jgi:hypothetical protein
VTTIEGVAKNGVVHPLQRAMIEHDGLQCGYCTPGQIMSGLALLDEGHAKTREEIREWISILESGPCTLTKLTPYQHGGGRAGARVRSGSRVRWSNWRCRRAWPRRSAPEPPRPPSGGELGLLGGMRERRGVRPGCRRLVTEEVDLDLGDVPVAELGVADP